MEEALSLPGLERLLRVCRETGYPADVLPAGRHPPEAGSLVAGYPFDPLLAALYRRTAGLRLGGPLGKFHSNRINDEINGVQSETESLRDPREPFHSTVLFGGASGLAWYYATVPVLADEQGLQPVVFIDGYEECPAFPVASNVDRFFHVFSRYVEEWVRDGAWQQEDAPELLFPWDMVDEVARDARLVELLKAGRFQFLMEHAPGSFQWVERVLGVLGT